MYFILTPYFLLLLNSNLANGNNEKEVSATSSYWTFYRKGNIVMANFDSAANAITIDTRWRNYGSIPVGFRPTFNINTNFMSSVNTGLINFNASAIQFLGTIGSFGSTKYVRAYLAYITNDDFPS